MMKTLEMTCTNMDCSLFEVPVERPSVLVIGPGMTIRPSHVCCECSFDLLAMPDKPVRPKFTMEQKNVIRDLIDEKLDADSAGRRELIIEYRILLGMIRDELDRCVQTVSH
jgi:hypothetical protein